MAPGVRTGLAVARALSGAPAAAPALFDALRAASPFFLIAGPCAVESGDHAVRMADALAHLSHRLQLPVVFKASFDKANRTTGSGPRGLGLDASLRVFEEVRRSTGLPVTTDVHESAQVASVAEVVDLLQVPAFLCRQTDLLAAAGASGRPVNVKKGQFASAAVMGHAASKLADAGCTGVLLTERGTTFGYSDLVVDVRNLPRMHAAAPDALVVMDATHSVQSPPAGDAMATPTAVTAGGRAFVPCVARAAAAVGAHGFFVETHDRPLGALSDAAVQWPLDRLEPLVRDLVAIAEAARGADAVEASGPSPSLHVE